jgi:hypothetical protein
MNNHEQRKADALDSYLTALQAGIHPSPPAELSDSETELLENLVAINQDNPPDPGFSPNLESQLRIAVRERSASKKRTPIRLKSLSILIPQIVNRIGKMERRSLSFAAGIMVVILVILAVSLFSQAELPVEPSQVVESFTNSPLPTAGDTAIAQIETEQPTSISPVPLELSSLPPLTAMMVGQSGGSGQGSEGEPIHIHFELNTTLPTSPEEMKFYLQSLPEPLTMEGVLQISRDLGLEARVYMPFWMTTQTSGEASREAYVAIDEPRYIFFDSPQRFTFMDRSLAPVHGGHWYPPQSLPPLEQALQTASAFLENAGLLEAPFETLAYGDQILFFHLLQSQWSLSSPFAQVYIHPDGQVKEMIYQDFELQDMGSYPILSADNAWEILRDGSFESRVWYRESSNMTAWAEWIHANPRYWAREYPLGGRVDLFGSLQVFYPTDPERMPAIRMNDLVLQGDLEPLAQAYQQLMDRTGDQETPLHVWGTVQDAGQYRTLLVEGWEETTTAIWLGTITHDGDMDFLLVEDGSTIQLPDLPPELTDGMSVFIQGGLWNDQLEWYIIQERPLDQGYGPPPGSFMGQENSVNASVDAVELIYFVPPMESFPQELVSDPGSRAIQPIWHFTGHTDRGTAFEAYVQAVDGTYLRIESESLVTPTQ